MKKSDEQIIEEAEAEFDRILREKVEEFRGKDEREELTIDNIDTMWGLARKAEDEVLRQVYTELTNSAGEGKIVKKKKRS